MRNYGPNQLDGIYFADHTSMIQRHAPYPRRTAADGSSRASRTVLLVEDAAMARKALAGLLRRDGYRLVPVSTAEQALAVLSEGIEVDIAVVDLDLPGMDGMSLVQIMERSYPSVRSILLTAADPPRVRRLIAGHRASYLPKPVDLGRLLMVMAMEGPISGTDCPSGLPHRGSSVA